MVQVVLVDVNPSMVSAWRRVFAEEPGVQVQQGSLLACAADAWVTPTNSKARMDGGLDGAIRAHFGARIQARVQREIAKLYHGHLPLGHATCVETGVSRPGFLVSTPTMHFRTEDVSDTLNTALACAAAFQAVFEKNQSTPGAIATLAMPGLGAGTGRVPTDLCAELMWSAYDLFREGGFPSFIAMRAALEERLGNLGPATPAPRTQRGWMSSATL